MEAIFIDLALVLALATVLAILMRVLKQPILIAYLLTGVSIPLAIGGVDIPKEQVDAFSAIGVALLLFIVGVKIDLRILGKLGRVSIVAGIVQMLLSAALVALISLGFGVPLMPALFLGIALSFSSTAIVIKLLTDLGDVEKLYGQMALGVLLIQDVVAVLALMLAGSLYSTDAMHIAYSLGQWVAVLAGLYVAAIYVLPAVTARIARSQELLFIFTIAWCFSVAALFDYLSIGIEIGALLAGISLSTSQYQHEISARIKPLRDFFLIMFFVALGLQLSLDSLQALLPIVVALTAAVIIGKLVFTAVPIALMGYGRRVAFLTGLSLSQVSEFSFILIGVGAGLGYITSDYMVLAIAVGIISIGVSSYLMTNGDALYRFIFRTPVSHVKKGTKGPELILFGYNRVGYDLLKSFKCLHCSTLVVDYDPSIVSMLKKRGVNVVYGDASDIEFLAEIDFSNAKMVVSTIPENTTNLLLLEFVKTQSRRNAVFIPTAHKIDDAMLMYDAGSDYVIMPHFLGGQHASSLLELYGTEKEKFRAEKARHIKELLARKRMGHEHPTLDYKI